MSEIAGRLAPQAGADNLEKPKGGRGILLGGVAGVAPARVLVIGGGMVGYNAAVIALGMGAQVTILERSVDRMRFLEQILSGACNSSCRPRCSSRSRSRRRTYDRRRPHSGRAGAEAR